jgi:hypothetical protein
VSQNAGKSVCILFNNDLIIHGVFLVKTGGNLRGEMGKKQAAKNANINLFEKN